MLNFLGNGSAFNSKLGNTSAFIKHNDSMILIDCGGTTFHRLQAYDLLDGIKYLYIVITHTHPDHVGSLGEVIFYSHYMLKIKPVILFPEKQLLEEFLECIGVRSKMYDLNSLKKVEYKDEQFGQFSIEFIPVSHVDTIPAFGFVINIFRKTIYFSGDSNSISTYILNRIISGK